jgi:hypothetical protein
MSEQEFDKNRRQRERLHLSLPIRVECREREQSESWEEITRLIDVTPFGAGFALSREVEVGRLILLTIPMPRQLRVYDHIEPQYKVYSLVRHTRRTVSGTGETAKVSCLIGVAFAGKYPPASYLENPSQLYEVIEPDVSGFWRLREIQTAGERSQSGQMRQFTHDMRRDTRHPIPLNVTIEVFDQKGETVAGEVTVTEDISLTGACVFTTLDVPRGRFVRLTCEQYGVTIVAIVRSRKIGSDGIARMHLEFIDRRFPLEII